MWDMRINKKYMEFKELNKKTKSELHKLLAESRDKLRDLRFKDANKQLKNVREIRLIRQMISRILTLLNKKGDISTASSQGGEQTASENKEVKDEKQEESAQGGPAEK